MPRNSQVNARQRLDRDTAVAKIDCLPDLNKVTLYFFNRSTSTLSIFPPTQIDLNIASYSYESLLKHIDRLLAEKESLGK